MKRAYENFSEIAEDFKRGGSWTHALSDHTNEECIPWQHGVAEFAKFLDAAGLEMLVDSDIYDKLWAEGKNSKPDSFGECPK